MHPVKITSKNKSSLLIKWDDSSQNELPVKLLRKECPCATCLVEREKQGKKYIPIFSDQEITIEKINVVGNYAISIEWRDGHNTGIYEFPFLLSLVVKDEKIFKA